MNRLNVIVFYHVYLVILNPNKKTEPNQILLFFFKNTIIFLTFVLRAAFWM